MTKRHIESKNVGRLGIEQNGESVTLSPIASNDWPITLTKREAKVLAEILQEASEKL